MIINFVGNYQQGPGGEPADETHITRSMEEEGHTIRRIPRDIWKAICDGETNPDWSECQPLPNADICFIAKWHHFNDAKYVTTLKEASSAHVFYWSFDSIDLGISWHKAMAQTADMYLSGELGRSADFEIHNIKFYYFQFDCVDGDMPIYQVPKQYDVSYLGSCDNQNGRITLLKQINEKIKITTFGNSVEDWQRQGFIAKEPVYGAEANRVIAASRIVLGTSCDPHLQGYWSNRVGRVLFARGKLLQQYTPGMENFLHDYVEYFSSAEEAIAKIQEMLSTSWKERQRSVYQRSTWTSKQKVKDLLIMVERYLKENNGRDWLLA